MPSMRSRRTRARAATPVLADSSAWIEYDRATGSAVHKRLRQLIANNGPLAVTEPVVMEICAGARSLSSESELRRFLARFKLLRFDSVSDFDGAARIYRQCRREGITPRGLIDCMIACVALRHGAILLSRDRDLASIAMVMDLELDTASHD